MNNTLNKQYLVWGILLVLFGTAAFIGYFIEIGLWGWVAILFAAGALSLLVTWSERSNIANLIPTYATWMIAIMIALIALGILRGTGIASYILFCVALPFGIGYIREKDHWGLLIPAYVLIMVGIMVGLIGLGWLVNLLIPSYVMFSIGIPFLVVYLKNQGNWWALIPAGIMFVIGFSFLLATPAVRFLAPVILVLFGGWLILRQLTQSGG